MRQPLRVLDFMRRLAMLLALCCTPVDARADSAPGNNTRGTFTILFENDVFGAQGSDRYYTQGLRFSYPTREGRVWDWVRHGARKLAFYTDGGRLRATYSVGQNLYTPEDILYRPGSRVYRHPARASTTLAGWLHDTGTARCGECRGTRRRTPHSTPATFAPD